MTPEALQQSPSPIFDPADRVHIADLAPTPLETSSHILANIALVWPYSSSTGTLALLLADPDIRRRKSKGQVKVVFRDGCAREVAQTKVGIGDVVRLALVGCEWKETGEFVSTPGKKIDWDLEYRSRVVLDILRDKQETLSINYTRNEQDPPATNGAAALLNNIQETRPLANGHEHRLPSTIQVPHFSPSKPARTSLGGTFLDAFLDSFKEEQEEEDGYVVGRGRKRTKFARQSGAWSLVDSDESESVETTALPEPELALQNGEVERNHTIQPVAEIDLTSDHSDHDGEDEQEPDRVQDVSPDTVHQIIAAPVQPPAEDAKMEVTTPPSSADQTESIPVSASMVMGPPETPVRVSRMQPSHNLDTEESKESSHAATTPRLYPLPSPGLPLVSPLVRAHGVELGYFAQYDRSESQLDASGKSLEDESPEEIENEAIESSSSDLEESLAIVEDISSPPNQTELSAESNGIEEPNIPQAVENANLMDLAIQAVREPVENQEQNQVQPDHPMLPEVTLVEEPRHPRTSHSEPATVAQHAEVVEIEDDDLYGAPVEGSRGDKSLPTSLSLEQPRSPLDVLEEFLQMSPVAVTTPADRFHFPVSSTVQSPQPQPAATQINSAAGQREEIVEEVAQDRSPEAYPAPDSPLGQPGIQQENSVGSSRRSSYHSQVRSFDGYVDELGGFPENESRSPEVVQGSNEPQSQMEAGSDGIESFTTQVGIQEIPTEDAPEAAEDALVRTGAFEHSAIETDLSEALAPDADRETMTTTSVVHETLVSVSLDKSDAQTQLPTPDQTQEQRDRSSLEVRVEESHIQESAGAQLPSPHDTQEGYEEETIYVAREEGTDAQAREAALSPPSSKTTIATPRRTSQRLSARKSSMARNISSPYFSPRKSAQAPASSPTATRTENRYSAAIDERSLPSSPVQEYGKSVKTLSLNAVEEYDVADSESTEPLLLRQTGITTSLSYFPHMTSLQEHFGQVVDVIAVCTDASASVERSKTGPKDYYTSLYLADVSLDAEEHPSVVAQVFRPVKSSLPIARRGDVVLLRNFKVQTSRRQAMLLSTDTSSWAVFQTADPDLLDVTVSGPPIEYGLAETEHVRLVVGWWEEQGGVRFPSRSANDREKEKSIELSPSLGTQVLSRIKGALRSNNKPTPANRRKENMTDHMASEGNTEDVFEADDHNESSPLLDMTNRRRESTISTAPSDAGKGFNPRRSARHMKSPSVVHELRDGTKYVDDDRRRSGSVVHELRDGSSYVDE